MAESWNKKEKEEETEKEKKDKADKMKERKENGSKKNLDDMMAYVVRTEILLPHLQIRKSVKR